MFFGKPGIQGFRLSRILNLGCIFRHNSRNTGSIRKFHVDSQASLSITIYTY